MTQPPRPPCLTDLFRYPVKGLSAERLAATTLTPGHGLPDDRRYALLYGTEAAEEAETDLGTWRPKRHFLMLARQARLAALRCCYDAAAGTLALHQGARELANGRLADPDDRHRLAAAVATFLGPDISAPVRLVEAQGCLFSDNPEPLLSLLNLASVRALAEVVGAPVDPRRFRANLWLDGAPAWAELNWSGRTLEIGAARLTCVGPIDRCAATTVNPDTAERDLNLPRILQKTYGHVDCGVFLRVRDGGRIAPGDPVCLI